MKSWQKILLALFAAAAAVVPIFVTNKASQEKAGKIEEAAGPVIGGIFKATE